MTVSNVLFGDWPMHSRATRWWASTLCQCPHQLKILMRKKRWDHHRRRHRHHHHNNIGMGITLSSESYCHRLQLTSCHLEFICLAQTLINDQYKCTQTVPTMIIYIHDYHIVTTAILAIFKVPNSDGRWERQREGPASSGACNWNSGELSKQITTITLRMVNNG